MKIKKILATGLFVFFYINSNSQNWLLAGNSGTTPPTQYLGTTDGQKLVLATNGIPRVTIGTNAGTINQGVVSIGNIDPDNSPYGGTLRIIGSDALTAIDLVRAPNSNANWDNQIRFYNTNNLRHVIADDYGSGKLVIQTNVDPGSGSTDLLDIRGRVQIGGGGISTPAGYALYVETGILTERVKVAIKTSGNWADHVFSSSYKLIPLTEVSAFIKKYKHLPGVPSAEELVKDGGIDVNQMFAKQMEKIEELTLHVIELNKRLDQLEKENKKLKASTPTIGK
jgi:hypothetical protein